MAEIDLTPTEEMAANAARGLELRRKHGRGGTEIGVARARDISNRKNLSPETVRRMHAFFSRHEKNKAGGEDDAGYIAWLLWGGDSGQSWAKRKVEQMNKGENERSDTYKEIAQRLGSAAKMGTNKRIIRRAGHEFLAEDEGNRTRISIKVDGAWEHATTVNTDNQTATEWIEANAKPGNPSRWLPSAHSRPGEKAKFAAQVSGSSFIIDDGKKFNISRWMNLSNASNAVQETVKRAAIVTDEKGKEWELKIYQNGSFVLRSPTAGGKRIEGKVASSRPGAKAKFAKRYDAKIVGNELVRSDGRRYRITGRKPSLPNAREMLGEVEWLMMVGENGSEYSVQRFDDGGYRVFGGGSGMRVQWDGLVRASRPGAKARMSKDWQTIERYLEVLDTEFGEPRGKAAAQEMMRAAAAIGGDEGARLKAAINTMATSRDYNARQRAYNAIASMMPFSRPGAKAKFAVAPEILRSINAGLNKMATEIGQLQDEGNIREANLRMKDWKDLEKVANAISAGDGSAEHAKRIASMLYHLDTEVREFIGGATREWLRKTTAYSRPGTKVANAVREGEKVSASDDAVSRKIRKLMDEGKPQKQAVAIALDLERRGEL